MLKTTKSSKVFKYLYLLAVIGLYNNFAFAQQITVDNTIPLQNLVLENLEENCVEITNISSSVNGSPFGLTSFGSFSKGSSNFPFESGIVLTTGNASSAGNNFISNPLNESNSSWGTDPDIEAALGSTNTTNATSIEFDFTSASGQFKFNYLLASEEYQDFNSFCGSQEGFVCLIREAATPTAPYQNIALVPSTTDPVIIRNISPGINTPTCPSRNLDFFAGFNLGDTNYEGRTTVLTAATTIIPRTTYHVKLIIADLNNGNADSAVFIEGSSFNIIDLGEDNPQQQCVDALTLNANINNSDAVYQWFINNSPVAGPTGTAPTFTVQALNTAPSIAPVYKVEVEIPGFCRVEDEIILNLVNGEEISPLTDFELCDTPGQEVFNLNTKTSEIANISQDIPFQIFTPTYHTSLANARSNSNAVSSVSPPVSEIFIRIQDQESNCFVISKFQLVVNPLPTNTTANSNICDCDNNPVDGFTTIDLTSQNTNVTLGAANVIVSSYHTSASDAENNIAPINAPENYINTTPNAAQVFARIENTATGCTNVSTLNISITNGPLINLSPIPLDACLADPNTNATFDLTTANAEILDGFVTSIPLRYFTSQDAAKNGLSNEISNSTAFTISAPEETVYVRVEDDGTGCVAVAPLELHKELLLTGTDDGPFGACDTNIFNLNDIRNRLFDRFRDENDNIPASYQARFFDTNDDLITSSQYTTTDTLTTIQVELTNTSVGCTKTKSITLRVDPTLTFSVKKIEKICDDTPPLNDKRTLINLNTLDAIATDGQANFSVQYFDDQTEAETPSLNAQPLGRFFQNTSDTSIVYARIESEDSECFHVTEFEIEVVPPPLLGTLNPLIPPCLPSGTTEATITAQDVEAVLGNVATTYLYFDNETDAENLSNTTNGRITFPLNYSIGIHEIFVRAENTTAVKSCSDTAQLQIIVNSEPVLPAPADRILTACEISSSPNADFTLSQFDTQILNNQVGSTTKEVLYFEDPALSIAIDKDVPRNFNGGTTIYVSIQNSLNPNGCPVSGPFTLQIGTIPVVNLPPTFTSCIPSGEPLIFNLETEANTIKQNTPNGNVLDFLFYEGQNTNRRLITNPTNYSLQASSTIDVEVRNRITGCTTNSISISLIPLEQPNVQDSKFPPVCDTDDQPYDGIATFDLSSPNNEIPDFLESASNSSINVNISYFNNLGDVSDASKAIDPTTLENFRSTSRKLYVKLVNIFAPNCPTIIALELEVVPPPTLKLIPNNTISDCFNTNNIYDLTQVNTELVDSASTVNISYHSTLEGARTNTDTFPNNIVTYTTPGDTPIWANVQDRNTSCSVVKEFILRIHPNPIANQPQNLVKCDDDFDNRLVFNLSEMNAEILGASQNISDYSVTYYESLANAQADIEALNTNYDAESNTPIFARVENTSTRCFATTSFNLLVNPLPLIPIDDVVTLCLNDLPLQIDASTGNPNDSYLWQTSVNTMVNGTTSPLITLTDPSQIGTYSVTVTTDNSASNTEDCPVTKTFTVIESQQAIIDISTKTDFVDPNSITVEVDGIGDYVFSLDGGEPQTSGFFANVTLGPHIVTVIDLNGCEPIDTEVFVMDIPKFFTPNNDGFFDTWHIVGARQLPGSEIFIYDRYGKLLKMLSYNSPGWNGTYNGQRMPTDDYWFSANIVQNGEMFTLKGHFTLRR